MGNLLDAERVTREDEHFPKRVADFLKEVRLPDQRPLINVCDRFDMVDRPHAPPLLEQHVQVYMSSTVNPMKAPQAPCLTPTAPSTFCARSFWARFSCLKRFNRLKLLQPWLEARVNEGMQEVAVHNALMKICIDMNNRPEEYLTPDIYYNSKVVGECTAKSATRSSPFPRLQARQMRRRAR